MTTQKMYPVDIKILGKDYQVACSEDERENLLESAYELDKKMRAIRDSGKVNGIDRIAVMAALNLTHELRQAEQKMANSANLSINEQLIKLRQKIENVLEKP